MLCLYGCVGEWLKRGFVFIFIIIKIDLLFAYAYL